MFVYQRVMIVSSGWLVIGTSDRNCLVSWLISHYLADFVSAKLQGLIIVVRCYKPTYN